MELQKSKTENNVTPQITRTSKLDTLCAFLLVGDILFSRSHCSYLFVLTTSGPCVEMRLQLGLPKEKHKRVKGKYMFFIIILHLFYSS